MTDVFGSLYRGEWQPDKDIIAEIERLRAECDMHKATCALLAMEVKRLTRERDEALLAARALLQEAYDAVYYGWPDLGAKIDAFLAETETKE